jgi:hypothetical protein
MRSPEKMMDTPEPENVANHMPTDDKSSIQNWWFVVLLALAYMTVTGIRSRVRREANARRETNDFQVRVPVR